MGFLSGPSIPPPPPPKPAPAPAVAPTVDIAKQRMAMEDEAGQAKGRAATMLTGSKGVASPTGGGLKQLLGS